MGCLGMVEEEDPYSLDLCGIILARQESFGSFFYAKDVCVWINFLPNMPTEVIISPQGCAVGNLKNR